MFDTEIIDRLFLELSQFTKAKTAKELRLEGSIDRALMYLQDATPAQKNGPCYRAISALAEAIGRIPQEATFAKEPTK